MRFHGLYVWVLFFSSVRSRPLEETVADDKTHWMNIGFSTLTRILNRKNHEGVAKNVIIFVGDGMGISTVTMARIYAGQKYQKAGGENHTLFFETFPSVGLAKTYDVSYQVSDSASTATAMFSGVKIKQAMIGLDARAQYANCDEAANARAKVTGFMTWAQEEGKDTGVVTTARVTHATPAGAYAHVNSRDWECYVPLPQTTCVKDIARQLVEDEPGKNFKVILGGGRQQFGVNSTESDYSCQRKDGRNLVQAWQINKINAKYVTTSKELKTVDENKTNYLLGLFAPGHLSYVGEKVESRPSLKEMTETAIKILKKNKKGFALMVEAARIDMAHHENYAKLALMEAVELDEAVAAAVAATDPQDTLIIVTADHSHVAQMNGYPPRGNDILGLAKNNSNGFFETITYANGPGYDYHHPDNNSVLATCPDTCSEVEKRHVGSIRNIINEPNREQEVFYRHFSGHYNKLASHGGEDVAVFASGPKAHLLVGVYEQNYIGTVIGYASCMGPFSIACSTPDSPTPDSPSASALLSSRLVLVWAFVVCALFASLG